MSTLMPMGIGPIEDRDEQQLNDIANALQSAGAVVGEQEFAALPAPVREALADVLHRFARGEAVVVGSAATLLTTGQAAAMLGMSRTYLVRLIDEGKVKCEFVGTHRRVRLEEALRYGEIFRRRRRAALDEIAGVSRDSGQYDGDEF